MLELVFNHSSKQVSAIYLHIYRDDFECDWLTLNTAKAPIMKGCAAICNQGDVF